MEESTCVWEREKKAAALEEMRDRRAKGRRTRLAAVTVNANCRLDPPRSVASLLVKEREACINTDAINTNNTPISDRTAVPSTSMSLIIEPLDFCSGVYESNDRL